jgi:N-acetylmuramoyl-L-alanine amidase
MASHFLKSSPCAALAVGLFLLIATGCQVQNKTMSTALLPPPSFDGPRVAPPGAPPSAGPLASAPSGPRAWVPIVPARPWKWIVIHHSASPTGSMAIFDKEHRAKGWDGVGYHFVIGNGTNSGDGQVEVTPRWPIQKWGAHAKTPDNRYNEYGIGICLVGNFDNSRPTAKQMQSLDKLVAYLMETYHITPQNVLGHRDTKPTDCPGRFMDLAVVRAQATQALAARGVTFPAPQAQTASVELLGAVSRYWRLRLNPPLPRIDYATQLHSGV